MNNDLRKDLNQSNKLRTYSYCKVKTLDNYRFTRSPTSSTESPWQNHRLAVETGRYMRPHKKPNERICRLFKKHAEDEKLFLFSCPVNQGKRKSIYKEFKIPIVKLLTENMSLLLLNPPSNNVEFQKIIAKHTRDCYEIRQKTLLALKIRKLSNF